MNTIYRFPIKETAKIMTDISLLQNFDVEFRLEQKKKKQHKILAWGLVT